MLVLAQFGNIQWKWKLLFYWPPSQTTVSLLNTLPNLLFLWSSWSLWVQVHQFSPYILLWWATGEQTKKKLKILLIPLNSSLWVTLTNSWSHSIPPQCKYPDKIPQYSFSKPNSLFSLRSALFPIPLVCEIKFWQIMQNKILRFFFDSSFFFSIFENICLFVLVGSGLKLLHATRTFNRSCGIFVVALGLNSLGRQA